MPTEKKSSIVLRLKEGQQNVTIEEVFRDLSKKSVFKLCLIEKYLYQGSRFVSSLGANMLVIANEFEGIQTAALELPYFEEVII